MKLELLAQTYEANKNIEQHRNKKTKYDIWHLRQRLYNSW